MVDQALSQLLQAGPAPLGADQEALLLLLKTPLTSRIDQCDNISMMITGSIIVQQGNPDLLLQRVEVVDRPVTTFTRVLSPSSNLNI